MGKIENLTGKKFDKLTVLEKTNKRKDGYIVWKCKCDCGNIVYYTTQRLKDPETKSCGCYHTKKMKEQSRKNFDGYWKNNFVDGTNLQKIRQGKNKNNTSGIKGVFYNTTSNKWVAQLTCKGKKYRKTFLKKEDAIKYRKQLEEQYFKPIVEKYEKLN